MQRRVTFAVLIALVVGLGIWSGLRLAAPKRPHWRDREARFAAALGLPSTDLHAPQRFIQRASKEPEFVFGRLVPLLRHRNRYVRDDAAKRLEEASCFWNPHAGAIPERFLDALIEAEGNGQDVSAAIAGVRTPRAADYLVARLLTEEHEFVSRYREPCTAPIVLEQLAVWLRRPAEVSLRGRRSASLVFCSAREEHPVPTATLLAVAQDATCLPSNRATAIEWLGLLGPRARDGASTIRALAQAESATFAEVVRVALLRIEAPTSPERFAEELRWERTSRDTLAPERICDRLTALGALGEDGRIAGPLAEEYLENVDWEVRLHAADALGRIHYTLAEQSLVHALANEDDWLLVCAAACALARMKATAAVPALEHTSATHWYPRARAAARKAAAVIRGHDTYVEPDVNWRIWEGKFFADVRRPSTEALPDNPVFHGRGVGTLSHWRCHMVDRNVQTVEWRMPDDPVYREDWWHEATCGVRFGRGILLGYNTGEFGGGVVYVTRRTAAQLLYPGVIRELWSMPFGVLVEPENYFREPEAIYLVLPERDGAVVNAIPWKRPPLEYFAPAGHGMLPNGDLVLGGFLVRRDGTTGLTTDALKWLEKAYAD